MEFSLGFGMLGSKKRLNFESRYECGQYVPSVGGNPFMAGNLVLPQIGSGRIRAGVFLKQIIEVFGFFRVLVCSNNYSFLFRT